MEFVSGLALILLTLAGYSGGAVLGARQRAPLPAWSDLLVIVVLWAGALVSRDGLGRWTAIALWLAAGLVVGAALASARRASYAKSKPEPPAANLWQAWKRFARRMGNYQSRVLMALLYFTVLLPFGLGVRLLSDPLHIKRRGASTWQAKQLLVKPTLEEAARQS